MKGIILGGGLGTRLYPSTIICNKQLEILYDKPVIYYSISFLMKCNVREINIVCRTEELGAYKLLLHDGKQWGISINYVLQNEPNGIIDGVKKCVENMQNEPCIIYLGDNFIYQNGLIDFFLENGTNIDGAVMLCIKKDYNHLISTIEFDNNENVSNIIRVNGPKGKYISPGIFLYDERLWEILGQLENDTPWVEVNKYYLKEKLLRVVKLPSSTVWHDVGVPNERLQAEEFIESTYLHLKELIGCPEEVALQKGWISKNQFDILVGKMPTCQYKTYLKGIAIENYSV